MVDHIEMRRLVDQLFARHSGIQLSSPAKDLARVDFPRCL
jgi:hypothetical protein